MPKILFLCTANVCRSPMAEALFGLVAKTYPDDRWEIASGGVWAMDGGYPALGVEEVLREEFALDIQNHRSRCVTPEMLAESDLVIVMEQAHKEALAVSYPQLQGRVYLLSEMTGGSFDIYDPIGGPRKEYLNSARHIYTLLQEGYARIRQLAVSQSLDQSRAGQRENP